MTVAKQRKEAIDRARKERGYPSRSGFVRDVLRDATEPMLTPAALREVARVSPSESTPFRQVTPAGSR